jgi:Flp pilus assembly protein TadB
MPPAAAPDATGPASLVLSGLILVAAAFLGWRQWRDYRSRTRQLSPLDENHFVRQDIRRLLGTIILVLVSLATGIGGQMPAKVGGQANVKFVQIWSGVAFLIVALLFLALLDWLSTRLYARRHRQRLTKEGLAIVEAELRIKTEIQRRQEELNQEEGSNGYHQGDDD